MASMPSRPQETPTIKFQNSQTDPLPAVLVVREVRPSEARNRQLCVTKVRFCNIGGEGRRTGCVATSGSSMPQQAVMQINPGRCLVNRREASHIHVVICRISRTTLGDRATNPGPRSWEASAKCSQQSNIARKQPLVRSPARHSDRVRNLMGRIRAPSDIRMSGPAHKVFALMTNVASNTSEGLNGRV
jgi:hypothetical protein